MEGVERMKAPWHKDDEKEASRHRAKKRGKEEEAEATTAEERTSKETGEG